MSSLLHRVLAGLLAVVLPVLVLWAGGSMLLAFESADDAQASRNAGRILNARVLQGNAAQVMDRLISERAPDVLVIGPSYANTDVQPTQLAAKLGVSKDDILLLSVPNSVGAHWYAILKHRVFEAGHRPRLIVVVSGLQSMLLAQPLTESSFVNLQVHLPPGGDPVVAAKIPGDASFAWARLREKRGQLRDGLLGLFRLPVSFLVKTPRGRHMGPLEARAALERVFDDSRIDMSLHNSAIPVVETSRREAVYTPDMLPAPADSFMGEISALAAAHDSRVVWVRPPMSPHVPAHLDDVVLPGVQEASVALVEAHGGSFVDMRGLPMSSAMFKNEDHMNEEGSRRFTAALAQALLDLDALTPGARPGALGDLRFDVRADAASPPAAEAALSGGGRWIPPGGRVVYRMAQPWDELRGTFEVGVVVEHLGARDEAPVKVVLGDGVVPLEARATGPRERWGGAMQPERPDQPFEVVVEVSADGPWVRVVALSLGRRLGRTFLEGSPSSMDGRSVALLGDTRVVDGAVVDQSVHPTYLSPPVRAPGHDRPSTDLPGQMAAFETERWTFLSDEALRGETNWGSRCSPLRVQEDDRVLDLANVTCLDVKRKGNGRSCHTLERIFFTASDGSDPATNGRTYRLVLDEERRCDGAAWLYPVDHFRVAFPPDRVSELGQGASWFTLGARYLNFREASIHVRLTVDGVTRIDEDIPGRDFKKGPRIWRLQPTLSPDASEVVVEVENLAHVFYLVTDITLSEREPGTP